MLSFLIKNLVKKSDILNNNKQPNIDEIKKQHRIQTNRLIEILENSYNVNLDTTSEWNTITLEKTKISTNQNCSGIYYDNKDQNGIIITAGHCITNNVDPGPDPTQIYLNNLWRITNPPNDNLGYTIDTAYYDSALIRFNKIDNYNYIDNVYILINPEDIIDRQELFTWGNTSKLNKVYVNRGLETDSDSFKWNQFNYYDGSKPPGGFKVGQKLYGFRLDLPTSTKSMYWEHVLKTLLPVSRPSKPGDSGGTCFIPFGKNKIALVGIISEKLGYAAKYSTNLTISTIIPELMKRGIRIKAIRIFYDRIGGNNVGPYFYEPQCWEGTNRYLYNPYRD